MGFQFLPRGGSKVLVNAMLQTQPETGKRVAGLDIDLEVPREPPQVAVMLNHKAQPSVYDHVVSTLPFGCLRLVGTRGRRMPFTLQQAIQSLQYEPPVKVAMRFSTRWWTTLQNRPSDSYCRLAFIRYRHRYGHHDRIVHVDSRCSKECSMSQKLVADKTLRDSTLSDLTEMHSVQYWCLVDQYQDHDTWSWDNSEFLVGACMTLYNPSASEELISGYSSRVYFVEDEELISTRRSKRKNRSTKSVSRHADVVCH